VIDQFKELLKIKSIVTIALTAVFCYLACTGAIRPEDALMIYTTVIAFYFGTKLEKNNKE